MDQDQEQSGFQHGVFFRFVSEFSLEVGGDYVVIERIWENIGFPSGTDAEAFRTVLDFRPQAISGLIGAFILPKDQAIALSERLDLLFESVMDATMELHETEGLTHIVEVDGAFVDAGSTLPARFSDVEYPGFHHARPEEEKSDVRGKRK